MSALFDHVERASKPTDVASSRPVNARFACACEDERGSFYVLNHRGEIRSTLSRDVVRYAVDLDANDGARARVVKHVPAYGKPFDAERVSVSPSGRHACASGERRPGRPARRVEAERRERAGVR